MSEVGVRVSQKEIHQVQPSDERDGTDRLHLRNTAPVLDPTILRSCRLVLTRLAHLARQDLVHGRLVRQPFFLGRLAQPAQYLRVQTDGDKLSWLIADGWPADPAHGRKLLVRKFADICKVNLLGLNTFFFLSDSRAAR